VKRLRPGLSDAPSLDERSWLDKANRPEFVPIAGWCGHMIKRADHDVTGCFAQSLRLKSKLHLVKGIGRCEVAFWNFPAVVASNGIRVIRPFRLAFAWRGEPLRLGEVLFGELAKLIGNRAGESRRPTRIPSPSARRPCGSRDDAGP
jgi:hypothetical protein